MNVYPLVDDRGQDGWQRAFVRPAGLCFFTCKPDPPLISNLMDLFADLEAGKVLQTNGTKGNHRDASGPFAVS